MNTSPVSSVSVTRPVDCSSVVEPLEGAALTTGEARPPFRIVNSALALCEVIFQKSLDTRLQTAPLAVLDDMEDVLAGARRSIAPAKETSASIPMMSASRLAEIEFAEREGVFEGEKIPLGSLGLMSGESRTGKGTLSLVLATAAAVGGKLGPGWACPKPRVSLYFTAEDTPARVQRRIDTIARGFGMSPLDIDKLHVIVKPRPALKFSRRPDVDALLQVLQPLKPELIFLDNLRRLFDGDENDGAVVAPVMEGVERVRDETGAAVLLLHHVGKARTGSNVYEARGSTVIPAIVDYHLRLTRPSGGVVVEVNCHDDRDGEDWRASFQQVRLADGGVKYKVLPSPESAAGAAREEALRRTEKALLDLATATPSGVRLSTLMERLGVARNTASKYMETLQHLGRAVPIPGPVGTAKLWLPKSGGGSP